MVGCSQHSLTSIDMANPKEIIRIGQTEVNFLLESKDTNGQLAMFEFTVLVGAKMPLPHYHENYDETVYGREGVLTLRVNGETIEVGKGECLFIPRGAVHTFMNLTEENVKALAVITPALIGPDFFRESGAIVNAGGPPDLEKLKVVFTKYGLVPVLLES
ncbi:MAG: cupin [Sediminibacterium sp.]|nr:cupin [Sediminibacterium sp.]